MGPFFLGRFMTFWMLFPVNVALAFLLSYVLVRYGIKHKKLYRFFADPPYQYLEKRELNSTYKFKAEYAMSFLLIPFALLMLALLSYVLTRPVPGIDQFEFFLMCLMGEFMLLIMAALMIKVTIETIVQDKELRHRTNHELFMVKEGIYLPITPLEGEWREIARKAGKKFFFLQYADVVEFIVEPARGSYMRPRPPYYKILLKDQPLALYFQRAQFYGHEKNFLETIAAAGVQVTYNDQLRS